jgi:tetraacyldisaccharide 4'-kinase
MSGLDYLLRRVRQRFESIIHKGGEAPFFSVETFLLVFSKCYGGAMVVRARLYESGILPSKKLPCIVISIGNLAAGGTGKTPITIALAKLISASGRRVVVISRGYGGRLEKRGGVVSDGENILFESVDSGDEPQLIARCLKGVPVVVGGRRYNAGLLAVTQFNPEIIILDDAFQHLKLKRNLNIVLLDCSAPFGNGHLLPRGALREPKSALARADAVFFTRCLEGDLPSRLKGLPDSLPIVHTRHDLVIRRVETGENLFIENRQDLSSLKGKRALAFAGLADNDQFFGSLQLAGCDLIQTLSFPDHHRYNSSDLDKIARVSTSCSAEVLITTLKDAVKLDIHRSWPIELVVIDVQIHFTESRDSILPLICTHL